MGAGQFLRTDRKIGLLKSSVEWRSAKTLRHALMINFNYGEYRLSSKSQNLA